MHLGLHFTCKLAAVKWRRNEQRHAGPSAAADSLFHCLYSVHCHKFVPSFR